MARALPSPIKESGVRAMSKRFGRNQKRAMREANNHLAEMVAKGKDREAFLQQQAAQNQRAVEMTAQILGEHFAGLPPKTFQVGEIFEGMRLPPSSHARFSTPEANHIPRRVMDMLILLVRSQGARRDELTRCVHFRFVTPAGDLAYGMSEDAYRRMPDDWFVERLPREIAREIADEVIEIRRRGGLRGR